MPISVSTTDFERTLLDCVNRILTGVGEPEVASITNATDTTLKAYHAVCDAVEDIYFRGPWEFRLKWMTVDLVANTMWYDLPDDFSEMATDIPVYLGTQLIEYIDFQELLRRYPDFRHYTNDAEIDLTVLTQATSAESQFSSATRYTFFNDQLGFWPIPDSDYATDQSLLLAAYLKMPAVMIGEGDLLDLPKNLWAAHYYLSLAFLKQHYMDRDYEADEARAERMIKRALARKTKRGRTWRRFVPVTQS